MQVLENFARDGVEVISSNPLAEACGVNGSQVRKDLAYFGEFGIRGVGYHITSLIAAITSSLGVDREWRMALVGVGNLGKAILNHGEFRARGFNIVGIFDCDPFNIGEIVHGLEVHCTKDLKAMVAEQNIEIGIITTPPERAQRAAQHLMDAGITSISTPWPSITRASTARPGRHDFSGGTPTGVSPFLSLTARSRPYAQVLCMAPCPRAADGTMAPLRPCADKSSPPAPFM